MIILKGKEHCISGGTLREISEKLTEYLGTLLDDDYVIPIALILPSTGSSRIIDNDIPIREWSLRDSVRYDAAFIVAKKEGNG